MANKLQHQLIDQKARLLSVYMVVLSTLNCQLSKDCNLTVSFVSNWTLIFINCLFSTECSTEHIDTHFEQSTKADYLAWLPFSRKERSYNITLAVPVRSNWARNDYFDSTRCSQNGVLFDVGHGQGSFDWEVVEASARIGFWPDLISTDLHSGNVNGAVRDLTNVASKFLLAGMSLYDVSIFLVNTLC